MALRSGGRQVVPLPGDISGQPKLSSAQLIPQPCCSGENNTLWWGREGKQLAEAAAPLQTRIPPIFLGSAERATSPRLQAMHTPWLSPRALEQPPPAPRPPPRHSHPD